MLGKKLPFKSSSIEQGPLHRVRSLVGQDNEERRKGGEMKMSGRTDGRATRTTHGAAPRTAAAAAMLAKQQMAAAGYVGDGGGGVFQDGAAPLSPLSGDEYDDTEERGRERDRAGAASVAVAPGGIGPVW